MSSLDRLLLETRAGTEFCRVNFKRRNWAQTRAWLDYAIAHYNAARLIAAAGVTVTIQR